MNVIELEQNKNVLIVEREEAWRILLKKYLEIRFGVTPDFADSCNDAIQKLSAHDYDFVISEFLLVGGTALDVFEFIESVRSNARYVVFTSFDPDQIHTRDQFVAIGKSDIKELLEYIELTGVLRDQYH